MMKRTLQGMILLAVVTSWGCASPPASPSHVASPDGNATLQIVGVVRDVHILGKKEETVTVCHFDPRYVVTVETDSGIKNLAIHSPSLTFMGINPEGKTYTFHLSKSQNGFLLQKADEMKP